MSVGAFILLSSTFDIKYHFFYIYKLEVCCRKNRASCNLSKAEKGAKPASMGFAPAPAPHFPSHCCHHPRPPHFPSCHCHCPMLSPFCFPCLFLLSCFQYLLCTCICKLTTIFVGLICILDLIGWWV
uniref:Uncharacterized protein n=1 Tax=Pipistrellus kuhlii TaxID=59472 RepID=A0A7J8A8N1_PIPKU|nr:hypothetical protein mPipKuh1_008981 [Pipistrellus kuhlii]